SPVVTLDKTAASIRLGNNTGVLLYTGSYYAGQSQTVELDTPCLDTTPIGSGTTSSLQVRPLAPTILLASGSCEHCQLVGVDLRGANLQGALASRNAAGQATDLSNATLTQAIFREAELTGVVLTGASLDGAHLTGATLTDVSLQSAKTWNGAVLDLVTGLA